MAYVYSDAGKMLHNIMENRKQLVALRGSNTIAKARAFAAMLEEDPTLLRDEKQIETLAKDLKVEQIRVFDKNLTITYTWPSVKDFDKIKSNITTNINAFGLSQKYAQQMKKVLQEKDYAIFQDLLPNFFTGKMIQLAGVAFPNRPGGIMLGYNMEYTLHWNETLTSLDQMHMLHVGRNGNLLLADAETGKLISTAEPELQNRDLQSIFGLKNYRLIQKEIASAKALYEHKGIQAVLQRSCRNAGSLTINGTRRLCSFLVYPIVYNENSFIYETKGKKELPKTGKNVVKWYLMGCSLPESEIYGQRNQALLELVCLYFALYLLIFWLTSYLFRHFIIHGLERTNTFLKKITDGNLNEKVSVCSCPEFRELSAGINTTVDSLRNNVQERNKRLERELHLAQKIQHSVMPRIFPPFPNRHDFDVCAVMKTAKEVGGDFYDFDLPNEDRFACFIADVSGKGIPAALFMMNAKTYSRRLLLAGLELPELFERLNSYINERNDVGMFLSLFGAQLEISTGIISCISAGHPVPWIIDTNGKCSTLFSESENYPILGLINNFQYKQLQIPLEKGVKLLLYTNGIIDALNTEGESFGRQRFCQLVEQVFAEKTDLRSSLQRILNEIDQYTEGIEQIDDYTMLVVEYKG